MAMVSSPFTARAHDRRRFIEAPLDHMHDECHNCTEASLESPPYRWTATITPSKAHS